MEASHNNSKDHHPIDPHYPASDTFVPPDIFGLKHTNMPYIATPERPSSAKASGLPVAFLLLGLLGMLLLMMPKEQNPKPPYYEHIAERFINEPMYVAPTYWCGNCYFHLLLEAANSGPLRYNYGYPSYRLAPDINHQIQMPNSYLSTVIGNCGPAEAPQFLYPPGDLIPNPQGT